jgi:hypothetical protein
MFIFILNFPLLKQTIAFHPRELLRHGHGVSAVRLLALFVRCLRGEVSEIGAAIRALGVEGEGSGGAVSWPQARLEAREAEGLYWDWVQHTVAREAGKSEHAEGGALSVHAWRCQCLMVACARRKNAVLKAYGDALAACADLEEEEEEELSEEVDGDDESEGSEEKEGEVKDTHTTRRVREGERDLLWLDLVQYLCAADPPSNPSSTGLLDALNRYLSELVLRLDVQRCFIYFPLEIENLILLSLG